MLPAETAARSGDDGNPPVKIDAHGVLSECLVWFGGTRNRGAHAPAEPHALDRTTSRRQREQTRRRRRLVAEDIPWTAVLARRQGGGRSPDRSAASAAPSPSAWPSRRAGRDLVAQGRRLRRGARAINASARRRPGDRRSPPTSRPRTNCAPGGRDARASSGRIDILVCNAASNPYYGPMAGIADEQFRKILDNNIVANHWLIEFRRAADDRSGATARSSSCRRSAGCAARR